MEGERPADRRIAAKPLVGAPQRRLQDAGRESGRTHRGRYELIRQSLLNERSSFDAHWRELGEYYMPRRTRFFAGDRNKGDRRSQSIIDSAPRFAARTLQSGLHAGITSPARPWMKLATPDPDLNKYQPVKVWLHTVTRRMLELFQKSNLYNVLPTLYGDMGTFGTGAISEMSDDVDVLRFYSYPLGSYVVGLDHRGLATTFAREYQLSVRQVVEAFVVVPGTNQADWTRVSKFVQEQWEKGNTEATVDCVWFVGPNDEHDPRALEAKYARKWRSCHYELGREDSSFVGRTGFLRESGFGSFPLLVPRWDITGEDTYGTDCPGMTALGDTKQLQLMQKQKAKAIAKSIDPPLKGSSSLRNQKTSLVSGDITYVDDRDGSSLAPIHEVRLEGLQYLIQDMGETRERVRRAFYEDLFLMLAVSRYGGGAQPITAREVEERHEEKLLALGPVLERLNDELLDPLIDRTFAMMLEEGGIPEPPEELQGVDLRVEYVSIMAQAQKLIGVTGQDRLLTSAMGLVEAFPAIRHKVKVFSAMDNYADMLGTSPELLRTDEEAQELADAEQEAQAAAANAETAQRMAQAGAALGKTPPTGSGTLLDQVLGVR